MGTMALFYVIYVINLFFAILLSPCTNQKRFKRLRRCSIRLNKKVYWGSLITLINETFPIVMIGSIINIEILNYNSPGYQAISVLCIMFLTFSILVPALLLLALLVKFDKLD